MCVSVRVCVCVCVCVFLFHLHRGDNRMNTHQQYEDIASCGDNFTVLTTIWNRFQQNIQIGLIRTHCIDRTSPHSHYMKTLVNDSYRNNGSVAKFDVPRTLNCGDIV